LRGGGLCGEQKQSSFYCPWDPEGGKGKRGVILSKDRSKKEKDDEGKQFRNQPKGGTNEQGEMHEQPRDGGGAAGTGNRVKARWVLAGRGNWRATRKNQQHLEEKRRVKFYVDCQPNDNSQRGKNKKVLWWVDLTHYAVPDKT